MRIVKEDCVGLVIDIQERLFPHMHKNAELERRTGILLDGLKVLGVPVLISEQYRKGLGPTLPWVESRLEKFLPLEKSSFSCCDDPGIQSSLESTGKNKVIICGIETHVCVLQTALDLLERGFTPVVIEDAVSSRKPNDKAIAIERMRAEGAVISTTESILFELARISGTDTFKAISKLVK